MRADSPNLCFIPGSLGRRSSAPNSLLCNTLHITYLESVFCGDAHSYLPGNPLRINILENSPKRSTEIDTQTGLQADHNSLFRNILRLSPCGSIFCRPTCLSPLGKSFGMIILAGSKKKIVRGYTQNSTRPSPQSGS